MSDIYYGGYKVEKAGINNILNGYCETNKNKEIAKTYKIELPDAIELMYSVFEDKKNIFRKVEKTTDDELIYVGNLNVSILEAMLGVALNRKSKVGKEDVKKIRYRYKNTMYGILEKSFNRIEENPFSVSTGTMQSIQRRFEICEMILGCR